MPDFEKMYFQLFNALTDAIKNIEDMNYGEVKAVLIEAQQNAEETYISGKAAE